ncbi:MAG: AAA family ATPase [Asgard group archaeon]|jgi:vacuolar protein-sorting-associated protein 4|nr:AAA family ATPase [Asgard group archaeon]
MSQNLYAKARKIAQEAVKADDSNNHKEAYRLYLQSAEILLELTKFTENPQLSKIYENRAKEYIGRAKTLNKLIKTQIPNKSSKNPSSSEENSEYDKVLESSIVSETPDLTLDDVAGLEDVKRSLREAIVLPLKRPDLFTGSRQPWRGILLHGPPGCGKTMIAKATAGDIKATFFNISAAVLVSKWLGESEKLVKRLYELAKEKQPSIIFIDEVDSLTQSRSENENDAMRRVKTQLLSSMEGISSNKDDRVVTIGATNVPWEIDSAFRRRFQRRIYVPLPDEKARKIIFEINSRGIELDKSIDFKKLSKITNDYTGSDIANICREAIMAPIRELDSTNMIDDSSIKAREVTHNDYTNALKNVSKSVSKQELIKFIEWDKEFGAG